MSKINSVTMDLTVGTFSVTTDLTNFIDQRQVINEINDEIIKNVSMCQGLACQGENTPPLIILTNQRALT